MKNDKNCPCPQCGKPAPFEILSTDRNRETTDQAFEYYKCSDCGLVFMFPLPRDMGLFYAGGYQPVPQSVEALREGAKAESFRLAELLRFKTSGRLLEIGPWIGFFAILAKDAGSDVETIEQDEDCARFLNDVVGIKTIRSDEPATVLSDSTTTYRRIDEGDFPKPYKLAVNISAWLESEIDAWVSRKANPEAGIPG